MVEEDQKYPDHPDRFDFCPELLCSDGLTDRCYWEVEWSRKVEISVSYRGIRKKGNSNDCEFGFNSQSWSLSCSDEGRYSVCHNSRRDFISSSSSSSSSSNRAAVYVDRPAGTLSFYRASSDTLIHLHTLKTTFTEPLHPGFWPGSSVSLCSVEKKQSLPLREALLAIAVYLIRNGQILFVYLHVYLFCTQHINCVIQYSLILFLTFRCDKMGVKLSAGLR